MPFAARTQFGPYEIIAPLGAGGMGEVYRARDSRLGRDVALKVLPASFSSDPDRLRRFEQEARAAGALNHPNILAIYDIGARDGAPYLVTELLEGHTLLDRLRGGPLPLRKALDIAVQTANGAAAAHDKGIIHRDLKPANIFLTADGRVKILDFGLAKLVQPDDSNRGETQSATRTDAGPLTDAGMVLGTLGYMSPEQVRGGPADARSDIFALGTILYEMLSGQRAFAKDSSADTMAAILKEEPPELSGEGGKISPAVDLVVRHCLEKNPGERFQSARDLAFDLHSLAALSTTTATALPAVKPVRARHWLLPSAALLAGLLGGFLLATFLLRGPAPAARITFHQVSDWTGTVFNARYAPDGETVIFSAAPEGNVPQLFVRRPDYPAPQSMAQPGTELLAISPRGEMAVLTGAHYIAHYVFTGTLSRMALGGGAPREVLTNVQDADWTPDGTALAVIREVNSKSRLEYPIGNVLYQTEGYVSDLRFSPRGDQIAFFEHPFRYDDRGSVDVVDLRGHKKILAQDYAGEEGLTWTRDGSTIYFGAWSSGEGAFLIHAVTLSRQAVPLVASTDNLWPYDRNDKDGLLASGNTYQLSLRVLAPGAISEQALSWLDYSNYPWLSPDGRRLLFTEEAQAAGPNYALLLRGTNGGPVLRLGDGIAMGLSPDGAWALSLVPSSVPRLVLYPTGAGEERTLQRGPIERYETARFFPDGKQLLACGNEPGHATRCYAQDILGGLPKAVTPEGTSNGVVSPDEKTILVQDGEGRYSIYPLAGGPGQPVSGLTSNDRVIRWTADGRGVLTFQRAQIPAQVDSVDVTTGRRTKIGELASANHAGALQILNASYSDDAKSYAYSYFANSSRLVIIKGVK